MDDEKTYDVAQKNKQMLSVHQNVFQACRSSSGTKQSKETSFNHMTNSENKQHMSSLYSCWPQLKATANSFSSASMYFIKYFISCWCTLATDAVFRSLWLDTIVSWPWSQYKPTLYNSCVCLSKPSLSSGSWLSIKINFLKIWKEDRMVLSCSFLQTTWVGWFTSVTAGLPKHENILTPPT